jgi:hypothetical protein
MALDDGRGRFLIFKLSYCKNGLLNFKIVGQNVILDRLCVFSTIVLSPEAQEDSAKGVIFFFYLLVVTATLLCLSGFDKQSHSFENLVHPPHVFVHEVRVVDLKKPMILFVLFKSPVA